MSTPILIDLSGIVEEFTLDKSETESLSKYVLSNISDEYMRVWERNINNSLHSTRSEYRRAIFTDQPDSNTMVFGMTPQKSKLGLMLEEGASEFDIKEGFKKSDKRKPAYRKNESTGWYLTIPFRHATSEAIAESMVFSSKMPKEIEKLVKTLDRPLKLTDLPDQYKELKTSRVGYQHRAAIYEGLKRQDISSTENENRGGYFTFRRVSDKSEADSWQHPGFEPLKLMEKTLREINIDFLTDQAIDDFLDTKFGK